MMLLSIRSDVMMAMMIRMTLQWQEVCHGMMGHGFHGIPNTGINNRTQNKSKAPGENCAASRPRIHWARDHRAASVVVILLPSA